MRGTNTGQTICGNWPPGRCVPGHRSHSTALTVRGYPKAVVLDLGESSRTRWRPFSPLGSKYRSGRTAVQRAPGAEVLALLTGAIGVIKWIKQPSTACQLFPAPGFSLGVSALLVELFIPRSPQYLGPEASRRRRGTVRCFMLVLNSRRDKCRRLGEPPRSITERIVSGLHRCNLGSKLRLRTSNLLHEVPNADDVAGDCLKLALNSVLLVDSQRSREFLREWTEPVQSEVQARALSVKLLREKAVCQNRQRGSF